MLLKVSGSRLEFKERDEDQFARCSGMRGKGTELYNGYWRTSRWTAKRVDGLGFVQMVAQEERQWEIYKRVAVKAGPPPLI